MTTGTTVQHRPEKFLSNRGVAGLAQRDNLDSPVVSAWTLVHIATFADGIAHPTKES
jgi:hypothetical protein